MQSREHGALLAAETSLVLVVDMQEAFRGGLRGFNSILPKAVQVVNAARLLGIPVIGSEQSPQRMGATIPELLQSVDHRLFYPKEAFSALQSTSIVETLTANAPRSIVLMGCETHIAVLQTALQLLASFDGEVHLVVDATASRRDQDRDLALERMRRTGVNLTSSEMVLFEWIRDTRHPRFQQIGMPSGASSRGPESSVI